MQRFSEATQNEAALIITTRNQILVNALRVAMALRRSKSYRREFKVEVVNFLHAHGRAATLAQFPAVPERTWRHWSTCFGRILATPCGARSSGGQGRSAKYPELEAELYRLAKERMEKGLPVTRSWYEAKAKTVAERLGLE